MPARQSKKKDFSQIALEVVEAATQSEITPPKPAKEKPKNPFAVALGKLGASKGGLARAEQLSKKRRIEIAKKAAKARWAKKHDPNNKT
jgi:uncharacterized OB-fold protein